MIDITASDYTTFIGVTVHGRRHGLPIAPQPCGGSDERHSIFVILRSATPLDANTRNATFPSCHSEAGAEESHCPTEKGSTGSKRDRRHASRPFAFTQGDNGAARVTAGRGGAG